VCIRVHPWPEQYLCEIFALFAPAKAHVSFRICYKEQYLGEYVADLSSAKSLSYTAADKRGLAPIENKRFIGVYRRLSVANLSFSAACWEKSSAQTVTPTRDAKC
jgi:hypothetical protein